MEGCTSAAGMGGIGKFQGMRSKVFQTWLHRSGKFDGGDNSGRGNVGLLGGRGVALLSGGWGSE